MSKENASGQESDDVYRCAIETCDYTTPSEHGIKSHLGGGHSTEEKEALYLDELHRLVDELGRVPTSEDMVEYGEFTIDPYVYHFGGWNKALEVAGYEPHCVPNIPKDELLSELRRMVDELGRPPSKSEMTDFGTFGTNTYQRNFGTWNKALKAAGLEPNQVRKIPDSALLSELRRVAAEVGRAPRIRDLERYSVYSIGPYQRAFSGWNGALKTAGFDLNCRRDIDENALLSELHRLSEELGRRPQQDDMTEYGVYCYKTYSDRFGSWNNAIEAAGFEPYTYPTGEDNPAWNGGHQGDYGPNWEEQRAKRIEYDDYQCVECGMSRNEHYAKHGRDFQIHHIKRKEDFRRSDGSLDYMRANAVGNLRTMCYEHHTKWEGLPVAPE